MHIDVKNLDPLDALILLQTAKGSWHLEDNLCLLLGKTLKEVDILPDERKEVWGTCLALALIDMKFPQKKHIIKMVMQRAYKFLEKEKLHPISCLEWGKQFLKYHHRPNLLVPK